MLTREELAQKLKEYGQDQVKNWVLRGVINYR